MKSAIKAKVGDYVGVPTRLLFPGRQSHWTRYDFQDGKVIAVNPSKKYENKLVLTVVFYDTFRAADFTEEGELIPTGELQTKNFYASACYAIPKWREEAIKTNIRYKYLTKL